MESILVRARAKINLALDVLRKREDGYHDLRMIMQTVYLHDILIIKKTDKYPFKLATDALHLPVDERNLVHQAAAFCMKEFNLDRGMFILLKKSIPMAAGLAGGSSDCAAAISGINRLYDLKLSNEEIRSIGKRFGADVPFCAMGGLALSEGIGDVLTPLPPLESASVVIAKPPIAVSTAQVYNSLSLEDIAMRPDIDKMIEDLKASDIKSAAKGMVNVLEPGCIEEHPEIGMLKSILLESDAMGAIMSGSGPSVFGIFQDQRQARNTVKKIRLLFPHAEVFLTGTCSL
ncbi:MAG: 4-(cytidine 5'-diphospho)-2-C-methyl-D-erythritol kinase [Clostridiales bacterium]|jgi:4-diphosphocytidyl-2-C-methyl-D-erythritol kinase|nr:4-(cytidine 5'-diphospho)-2-C-methyl-D-erythritol kinase [Clostridiales bacterium]